MLRAIGYGVISWAVPYVTAVALLPLMHRDPAFFKTIMIVEGSMVGAILVAAYFQKVEGHFLREGIVVGAVWVLVNWVLDYVALLPFSKMPLGRYFMEIGFEYIGIFAPTVVVGYVLATRLSLGGKVPAGTGAPHR